MSHRFILASTSPYRKTLLEKLRLPFESAAPNVDETALPDETAEALVQRLARMKAENVAQHYSGCWVIGSDQVATLDNQILTKPGTAAGAQHQLSMCSGRRVSFWTGLALIHPHTGTIQVAAEVFHVHFRQLSAAQINRYIALEQPLDCAGSFKSEGLGICLFERFDGRDPNTLIGLPLMLLCDLLSAQQIHLPLT